MKENINFFYIGWTDRMSTFLNKVGKHYKVEFGLTATTIDGRIIEYEKIKSRYIASEKVSIYDIEKYSISLGGNTVHYECEDEYLNYYRASFLIAKLFGKDYQLYFNTYTYETDTVGLAILSQTGVEKIINDPNRMFEVEYAVLEEKEDSAKKPIIKKKVEHTTPELNFINGKEEVINVPKSTKRIGYIINNYVKELNINEGLLYIRGIRSCGRLRYIYFPDSFEGFMDSDYELEIYYCDISLPLKDVFCDRYFIPAKFYGNIELRDSDYANHKGKDGKTASMFLTGAENKDVSAIRNLADCYFYGYGVPQSYQNALKLYIEAGDALSCYKVFDMHDRGLGTKIDIKEAHKYLQLSADLGYSRAQYVAYWRRNLNYGFRQDTDFYNYLEKAVKQGHLGALKSIDKDNPYYVEVINDMISKAKEGDLNSFEFISYELKDRENMYSLVYYYRINMPEIFDQAINLIKSKLNYFIDKVL